MKTIRVSLSKTAQSAIEIGVDGIDETICEECEKAVARAFTGKALVFPASEADAVIRGLIEFSNSEDGQVEERAATDEQGKKHGKAAIRALQATIERVSKAG